MKILEISEVKSEYIVTDEALFNIHIRHSSDNWETIMGESTETTYDCEELEKAYQEFKKINK